LTRCVLLPGLPRSRGRRVSHATAWQCRPTAPCGGRGWASDARRRRRGTRGVGEPSEAWACVHPSTRIVSRQAWPLARACPGRPGPPLVRRAPSIAVPCPCGMQIAGRGSYPSHGHGRRARRGWHASGTISLNLEDIKEPSNVSHVGKNAHPGLDHTLHQRHVRPGPDGWGRGDGECRQWHDRPRDPGWHRQ